MNVHVNAAEWFSANTYVQSRMRLKELGNMFTWNVLKVSDGIDQFTQRLPLYSPQGLA